jgi:hypothetical protein
MPECWCRQKVWSDVVISAVSPRRWSIIGIPASLWSFRYWSSELCPLVASRDMNSRNSTTERDVSGNESWLSWRQPFGSDLRLDYTAPQRRGSGRDNLVIRPPPSPPITDKITQTNPAYFAHPICAVADIRRNSPYANVNGPSERAIFPFLIIDNSIINEYTYRATGNFVILYFIPFEQL